MLQNRFSIPVALQAGAYSSDAYTRNLTYRVKILKNFSSVVLREAQVLWLKKEVLELSGDIPVVHRLRVRPVQDTARDTASLFSF